ncbi:hypothetical protein [Hymenobacter swuensis]|uniref:Peptidase A2 domain-containing protein n=1 Tax=Hymenobacter swuensis DY53 TaxID=1227739 RepID=W8FAU6_9BACT|nr:hypothetical protein [Hymenobacter swuensis]AHJ99766.1 hypothetical protein Hsw_4171 [Hymenobacter swuensis DY53]
MKLLRNVLLVILTLLLLGGVGGYFYMRKKFEPAPNQLAVAGLPATCTFVWQADSSARPVVAQAALLLPVSLPGCARTCYLQFDTGAPTSLLYTHPLAALRARYPDTRQYLLPQADTLHNFRFALGQSQVQARRMRVLTYGAHQLPADSTAPFIIGTLGADVLENRVLVLDYPGQRFSLEAQFPDSLSRRTEFVPLAFDSRRIMLSAGVAGETKPLLFDSGSSAFALLTSQATWQQMARPQALARTSAVNSMGRTLTSHTIATAAALQLGAVALPLQTVTYIEGTSLMESLLMRFSGMGGMLGNRPFNQHTIVVDVSHQRFGLVR